MSVSPSKQWVSQQHTCGALTMNAFETEKLIYTIKVRTFFVFSLLHVSKQIQQGVVRSVKLAII